MQPTLGKVFPIRPRDTGTAKLTAVDSKTQYHDVQIADLQTQVATMPSYSAGTWPVGAGSLEFTGAAPGYNAQYVRIGNLVTFCIEILRGENLVADQGTTYLTLPFPSAISSTALITDRGIDNMGTCGIRPGEAKVYLAGISGFSDSLVMVSGSYICTDENAP